MALNKEDKADVRGAMGKALANKVAKVTRDKGSSIESSKYYVRAKKMQEHKKTNPEMYSKDKKQPVQVSREWYKGKRQMVGFYEGKGGSITIKPHKEGESARDKAFKAQQAQFAVDRSSKNKK